MTAEEMLTQTLAEASNNYPTLTVNWMTRQIDIPDDLTFLGVESDDDVRRVRFVIPKHYRDVDLSDFTISVNYMNANAEGDVYQARDISIENDVITFTWLIGRRALAYKGDVKFNICLKKADISDPTIVEKELNTTIASLPVLEGLETSEAVIQEYADILLQWEHELESKFKTLESRVDKAVEEKVSDDRIEELVLAYLEKNPIENVTISKEDIIAAVEAYFIEHPIEGGIITESQIKKAIEEYLTEHPIEVGDSLPDGGTTGQVLTKKSDANGDAEWRNPPSGNSDVSWNDIKDKPGSFHPTEHSHEVLWNDIKEKPESYPPSEHSHDIDWTDINNKPETFTPPIASSTTLGGVKVGSGLSVSADGTVSVGATSGIKGAYMMKFICFSSQDLFGGMRQYINDVSDSDIKYNHVYSASMMITDIDQHFIVQSVDARDDRAYIMVRRVWEDESFPDNMWFNLVYD